MKSLTKKQIGVIYGAAKRGEITLPKWFASACYDMVENMDYAYGNGPRCHGDLYLDIHMAAEGILRRIFNEVDTDQPVQDVVNEWLSVKELDSWKDTYVAKVGDKAV